ncbi:MAG: hypothetical protein JWN53_898 [Gemmatimonadetes bacterium]|jgi:ActR/RegA family two-component response regulator|nr:hypothetical protein [Gemmatimonadota bacterium]
MMMAFDSSKTPPSRLDDETIDAVRVALRAYLADPTEPSSLQRALLSMATEARAKSIPPEQLLIALKEVWGSLPEVRTMSDTNRQTTLLQRIVTMCIKEYYA